MAGRESVAEVVEEVGVGTGADLPIVMSRATRRPGAGTVRAGFADPWPQARNDHLLCNFRKLFGEHALRTIFGREKLVGVQPIGYTDRHVCKPQRTDLEKTGPIGPALPIPSAAYRPLKLKCGIPFLTKRLLDLPLPSADSESSEFPVFLRYIDV